MGAEQLRPEHVAYYPDRMYMYAGKETGIYGKTQQIGWIKGILRQGHPEVQISPGETLGLNKNYCTPGSYWSL